MCVHVKVKFTMEFSMSWFPKESQYAHVFCMWNIFMKPKGKFLHHTILN